MDIQGTYNSLAHILSRKLWVVKTVVASPNDWCVFQNEQAWKPKNTCAHVWVLTSYYYLFPMFIRCKRDEKMTYTTHSGSPRSLERVLGEENNRRWVRGFLGPERKKTKTNCWK